MSFLVLPLYFSSCTGRLNSSRLKLGYESRLEFAASWYFTNISQSYCGLLVTWQLFLLLRPNYPFFDIALQSHLSLFRRLRVISKIQDYFVSQGLMETLFKLLNRTGTTIFVEVMSLIKCMLFNANKNVQVSLKSKAA